jgi:serine/threonine protein kinase
MGAGGSLLGNGPRRPYWEGFFSGTEKKVVQSRFAVIDPIEGDQTQVIIPEAVMHHIGLPAFTLEHYNTVYAHPERSKELIPAGMFARRQGSSSSRPSSLEDLQPGDAVMSNKRDFLTGKNSQYVLGEILGMGAFGSVFALGSDKVIKFIKSKHAIHDTSFFIETLIQHLVYTDIMSNLTTPGTYASVPKLYDFFRVIFENKEVCNCIVMQRVQFTMMDHIMPKETSKVFAMPIHLTTGHYDLSNPSDLARIATQIFPDGRGILEKKGGRLYLRHPDHFTLTPGRDFSDLGFFETVDGSPLDAVYYEGKFVIRAAHAPIVKILCVLSPEERATHCAMALYQVGRSLDVLMRLRNYNHCDLKCNNVMMSWLPRSTLNSNGFLCPQFYMIDFGMSRLEYNGFLFNGPLSPRGPHVLTEDVAFFTYSMIMLSSCEKELVPIPNPSEAHCELWEPRFAQALDTFFHSLDANIRTKFLAGSYMRDWRQMYRDAHTIQDSTTNRIVEMANVGKNYLQTVARASSSTATEPFFFGRRRLVLK